MFTDSLVQALSKTLIKITEAVYKLIFYRFIHIFARYCFWRENSPERGIRSESEWRKHQNFSDDSSERLWLVFISSTESCVIGYNTRSAVKSICFWLSAISRQ